MLILLYNQSCMKEQSSPHELMHYEQASPHQELACSYCFETYPKELMQEHLFYCEVGKDMAMEQEHFECRLCFQQLTQRQLAVHAETCSEEYIKCFFCDAVMQKYIFNRHECQYFVKYEQERKDMPKERLEMMLEKEYLDDVCIWCRGKMKKDEQKHHSLSCMAKLTIRRTLANCELTKLEYDNLKFLYKRSAKQHLEVQQATILKFKGLGYSQEDLKNMSKFIGQQAPLIIHCQLEKMLPYFLKDNYYRNLFETNHSGGSNSRGKRMKWQEYLYGDLYVNCYDDERIKYGTINYTNDKYGIAKCKGYGYSVIVLKESVRVRCTICDDRKYAPGQIVTTLMHNYPVLGLFKPEELKILNYAVKGFEIESNVLEQFKEIHVHGQIRLDRDVECIYTSEKTIEKMLSSVLEFQQLYKVKIIPFQAFFHQFVSPQYEQ